MKLFAYILLASSLSLFVSHAPRAEDATAPASGGGKKVYKQVNPDGTITYSDKPAAGAEEVKVPTVPTYQPPKVPEFTPYQKPEKPAPFAYDSLKITSPANDETIRENVGDVTVVLSVSPSLRPGHRIEYLLDGASVERSTQSSYQFKNMDRGSHNLTAQIVDESGNVLNSSSVTVHLQRTSTLQPGRNPPAFPAPHPQPR